MTRIGGLVSTIIPVHNRSGGLRDAVASVLAQDYRPIEIIVVDDGSTDETADVAHALACAHAEVSALRQENAGPGAARERGRRASRGEFIQYLDSDDVLLPGKFAGQVRALVETPKADIAYGWTRYRRADGSVQPTPWKRSGEVRETLFPSVLVERWWDTPTPLYRASLCDRGGGWLSLSQEEDWEYDCRLGALGAVLVHCPQYVCEVRDHGGERLSRDGALPSRLRDRAAAHEAMFHHARTAGLPIDAPESTAFSRRLFLLARQCGAAGLEAEAIRLFGLARERTARGNRGGIDFIVYGAIARLIGWRAAGRLASWRDQLREAVTRA